MGQWFRLSIKGTPSSPDGERAGDGRLLLGPNATQARPKYKKTLDVTQANCSKVKFQWVRGVGRRGRKERERRGGRGGVTQANFSGQL